MSLIVEDGTGVSGANSYASLAFADAWAATTALATKWAALLTAERERLLQRATMSLDMLCRWKGYKLNESQALGWPRQAVPWDKPIEPGFFSNGGFYPENKVPLEVQRATAEYATMIITGERTGDIQGAGIHSLGVGKGAVEIEFNAATTPESLGRMIPGLLSDFVDSIGGSPNGSSGARSTYRS